MDHVGQPASNSITNISVKRSHHNTTYLVTSSVSNANSSMRDVRLYELDDDIANQSNIISFVQHIERKTDNHDLPAILKESNVHFLHIPFSDKPVKYYSLDVIISVGYRVKSRRGTDFRRWANKILKEYLLRGYAINQRIERLEHFQTRTQCDSPNYHQDNFQSVPIGFESPQQSVSGYLIGTKIISVNCYRIDIQLHNNSCFEKRWDKKLTPSDNPLTSVIMK